MPAPVICEEMKKPIIKHERRMSKTEKRSSVRPNVADLINKVVQENASTWKALAKR